MALIKSYSNDNLLFGYLDVGLVFFATYSLVGHISIFCIITVVMLDYCILSFLKRKIKHVSMCCLIEDKIFSTD